VHIGCKQPIYFLIGDGVCGGKVMPRSQHATAGTVNGMRVRISHCFAGTSNVRPSWIGIGPLET